MFAIVKFQGETFPSFFQISHIQHARRLSTMENVEWVCAAHITSDGKIVGAEPRNYRISSFNEVIIPPFSGLEWDDAADG